MNENNLLDKEACYAQMELRKGGPCVYETAQELLMHMRGSAEGLTSEQLCRRWLWLEARLKQWGANQSLSEYHLECYLKAALAETQEYSVLAYFSQV